MKRKVINYTLDTLPTLTDAQRKHLDKLAQMSDDQINYDDIPELTDKQLAEMKRAEHYRPIKQQITVRLDADVLAWLKASGKGYQSRMNAILRQAMLNTVGNFRITNFRAQEHCAEVTFCVEGTEYKQTVSVVSGRRLANKEYWEKNRPDVEKRAVGVWLAYKWTEDKSSWETFEAMLAFAQSGKFSS